MKCKKYNYEGNEFKSSVFCVQGFRQDSVTLKKQGKQNVNSIHTTTTATKGKACDVYEIKFTMTQKKLKV